LSLTPQLQSTKRVLQFPYVAPLSAALALNASTSLAVHSVVVEWKNVWRFFFSRLLADPSLLADHNLSLEAKKNISSAVRFCTILRLQRRDG
jgi:hypothetical protein